jgi:NADH-ubiquinone oxidoreductase chain 6
VHNLFITYETYTNGYRVEFLDLSSLASVFSGILVIISKNPIVSVLCLIALFLSISCYLITLGLSFIGLSYLLVYVGAVSILFLFILMLINVRVSELLSDTSNSIPLAILVVIPFNYIVYQIIPYGVSKFNNYNLYLNDFFNNSYSNYLSKIYKSFENNHDIGFVTGKS